MKQPNYTKRYYAVAIVAAVGQVPLIALSTMPILATITCSLIATAGFILAGYFLAVREFDKLLIEIVKNDKKTRE
jgi:hypothetical protein